MPIDDGVWEVERRLKAATSAGVVSLTDYMGLVDAVAADASCDRDELHEEVRSVLGHAFGIEAMDPAAPRR